MARRSKMKNQKKRVKLTEYEKSVRALEAEGLTRSDAQAIIDLQNIRAWDAELKRGKHSKGPWFAHTDVEEPVITALGEYDEPQVALVSNIEGQTKHNARLIAAAPELLEALEAAIEYFENNGGQESYTWLFKMKDIVSKARGGN
jgi:hypothetical protein